ncbi:MAG: class A beta-lactamase-related serine hydrolase [Ruminococcus sp.]|nr:class A beta-lactamase-related serine hydrolase [Ruminococcus sp.]
MTIRKRLISVIMAVCFITVFAGCTDTVEKSSTTDSSSSVTEQEEETTTTSTTTTTTTTITTTTTTTTAVTLEYNPASVDTNSFDYSFSLSDFDMVTSPSDFENFLDELQEVVNEADFKLAFSFKNIETGAAINYNESASFLTCSTIKAPFVKSILEQNINLDEMISKTLTWSGDTGYVASLDYGTQISAKELIRRTLSYSDNSAYYNLHNYYGYSQFNANQAELGSSITLGSSWIFTYCTSLDMLKNFEDIYYYIEDGEYGDLMLEYMTADDVDVNMQIRYALESKYTVAEKYGSQFNSGSQFHACAIVYADSPFVLTIFTDQYPETEESAKVFQNLAVIFDNINTVIYTQ